MNVHITFPEYHGTDKALAALEYQRALLSCLADSIDGANIDIEDWLLTLKLCSTLAQTATDSLKATEDDA